MATKTDLFSIETASPEATFQFAQNLAKLLQAGDALSLNGTLGAGKTHFAQGLARGLGVPSDIYVTSPTFTIINQYACNTARFSGPFFHLDLYRLEEPDELLEIGYYDLIRGGCIIAVEWWDNFPEEIPDDTLIITLAITGDSTRVITLSSATPDRWTPRLALL